MSESILKSVGSFLSGMTWRDAMKVGGVLCAITLGVIAVDHFFFGFGQAKRLESAIELLRKVDTSSPPTDSRALIESDGLKTQIREKLVNLVEGHDWSLGSMRFLWSGAIYGLLFVVAVVLHRRRRTTDTKNSVIAFGALGTTSLLISAWAFNESGLWTLLVLAPLLAIPAMVVFVKLLTLLAKALPSSSK